MKSTNPDLVDQTIHLWRHRTGRAVSSEDAKEIIHNISGFFEVLLSWDHKDREEHGDVREPQRTINRKQSHYSNKPTGQFPSKRRY